MKLDRPGRRRAGAGHAARAVRHAAAVRPRLLAEAGEDHPGRRRSAKMLGLVKPMSVGICGDAQVRRAPRCSPASPAGRSPAGRTRPSATRRSAPRRRRGRRSSTAGRTRRDPWSVEISRGLGGDAPAADAARARARDAGGRDGLHRHRQHLLGVEQLPALRAPALDVRGDELRQLRLRVPGRLRRQGRRARPSGDRLRRRRRLGHQPERAPDLRAREDRRHRRACSTTASGAPRRRTTSTSTRTASWASNLDNPSWAGVAKSLRLRGRHASTSSSDVGPALRRRSRPRSDGRTTVIEMMVTQELGDPFRRDALSVPVRHLDKYKDYV